MKRNKVTISRSGEKERKKNAKQQEFLFLLDKRAVRMSVAACVREMIGNVCRYLLVYEKRDENPFKVRRIARLFASTDASVSWLRGETFRIR